MGDPLQKISERGGGQKGKAVALLLLPLLASFAALMAPISARRPDLWFSYTVALFIIYTASSLFAGRTGKWPAYSELLKASAFLSAGLLISGATVLLWMGWLHVAYVPLAVLAATVLGREALLAVLMAVPLLELRHLTGIGSGAAGAIYEELTIIGAAYVSAGASALSIRRLRRRAERLSVVLKSMREGAIESLQSGDLITHGASHKMKADEELAELLGTVRITLGPGAASLFLYKDGELYLRLSTESENVIPSGEGLIQLCGNRRHTVLLNEPKEGYNPGYIRNGVISSMMAVPVMDGGIVLGVLAVDSEKEGAFGRDGLEALGLFSKQVANVLKKQRIFSEMERSQYGLRVLHEESSALLTSLSVEHIAGKMAEGAYRIAPLKVAVLLRERGRYRLVKETGIKTPGNRLFSLKNTLLEMAVKNREHIYISNMKSYSIPAVPFDAGKVGSAFMLPLIYENEPGGALVLVSEKPNALNPYQIELLEVLGNQAATSMANAALHEKIERMATTDGLTGLYNHRLFQERLNEELTRLRRFPKPLTLILIDIDFFKKVNDSHGHPAGDSVLKSVAAIIRKAVRDVDIPARYGGEEFAAVLVGTDGKGAGETAERLRRSIEKAVFPVEGKKLKVTVSIGVASIPLDATTKEELIDRADKALYRAKKTGRNRVVFWPEAAAAAADEAGKAEEQGDTDR